MAACIRAPRTDEGGTSVVVDDTQAALARQHSNFIQIYSDWANHYLEKAKCKRKIRDLQADVADGVLLADVIEAVTGQKVPDINRKPKSSSQMIENIRRSLSFVESLGVAIEGICAKDVRDGNLKAILGLFFALSRHKQQQKQRAAERDRLAKLAPTAVSLTPPSPATPPVTPPVSTTPLPAAADMTRLPSPFNNKHGGVATSIPVPASSTPIRRNPPDKGRHLVPPGTPSLGHSHQSQIPATPVKCTSANSSRSTSPSSSGHSFIPTPRSSGPGNRGSITEKHINVASRQGLRAPSTGIASPYGSPAQQNASAKSSMLDKFKLFNNKDKTDKIKLNSGTGVSKRTSSSSGFSSARSERSDSSTSLCSDAKPSASSDKKEPSPPPSANPPPAAPIPAPQGDSSPKSLTHGLKSKLSRSSRDSKQSSPKTNRKDEAQKLLRPSSGKDPDRLRGGSVCGVISGLDRSQNKSIAKPVSPSAIPNRLSAPTPTDDKKTSLNMSQVVTENGHPETTSSPGSTNPTAPSGGAVPIGGAAPAGGTAPTAGTGIPKPTAAVKGTSKPSRDSHGSLISLKSEKDSVLKSKQLTREEVANLTNNANNVTNVNNVNANVSIALVTPMVPNENSQLSNANSTGQSNNVSTNDSGKLTNNLIIGKDGVSALTREGTFGDEDETTMNVKPMQPLLQGYQRPGSAPFTGRPMPSPKQQCVYQSNSNSKYICYPENVDLKQRRDNDYTNIETIDNASGYLSDGDILRRETSNAVPDVCDGYMSEGGTTVYVHRMYAQQNRPPHDPRDEACSGPKLYIALLRMTKDAGAMLLVVSRRAALEDILHRSGQNLVILYFYAQWCAHCRSVGSAFEALTRRYPDVTFVMIEIDNCEDILQDFPIQGMPSFFFIKGRRIIDKFFGVALDKVEERIQKYR